MGLQIPTRTFYATPANTPSLFDGASPDGQLALANAGLANQKLAAAQAFSGGFPTDASGNPDYMAAAKVLFQKGDLGDATSLIQAGNQQRALAMGLSAADNLANGNPPSGTVPSSGGTPTANSGAMPVFLNALASVESKGNGDYSAIGPVTKTGDRAYGKYQVMGANIPSWTKEVLGQAMTPEDFAANPQAQDAVASAKFGQFLKQTGTPQGAASMWFTGRANAPDAQDALGTTGAGYVQKFMAALPRGGQPSGTAAAPVQVAQNGASDASDDAAVSGTHPYAPVAPASQPPAPAASPAAGQVAGNPGAPLPVIPVAPAPNPTNVPGQVGPTGQQQAGLLDPTMGGLLKGAWVGNPGGYVNALRAQAVKLATLGNTAAASAFDKQADAVERGIERNGIVTPEMKNYQVALGQGFTGSLLDFQRQQEVNKLAAIGDQTVLRAKGQAAAADAAGAAQGKAPYELHTVQATPGGPTTYQSTADITASPTPVVSEQPKVFAQDQDALGKTLSAIPDQMQQRQIAQERIGAMTKLLETFQTGAGADQKAAAIAGARSLGFNIPDSATGNPAAVEQFAKNATANIFAQAKSLGGKILVSELAGLQKSNANPNMQPGSNAAILAQQKGLLDWQDAHDQALLNWSQDPANQNAYTAAPFEAAWMKANPPSAYVAKAKLDIAPLGVPVPPPAQRTVGQRYNIPGKGIYRWMGNGWAQ